jgi:hypothetical protein
VFTATDPEARSAYNAALAGGVPVVMEPWLLEEVIPRLQPEMVIWGLSSMDLSTSYGADNLDRYRDALETRTGTLAAVEQTTARFSALVRYRTILRRPSALFGTEAAIIEDDFATAAAVLGPGGERLDFTIDLAPDRATQVQTRLRNYHIDPVDIDAMQRTVDALRNDGITVVLAELPAPDRYVALHPEGAVDMARAHEAIRAIAEILEIPVIDLRYGYTDDDFVDYTHLDQAAAADLTTRLTTALTTTPAAEPTVESLLATANHAIGVVDRLYQPLLAGGDVERPPEYWISVNHQGRYGDLANAEQDGGFDIVTVGSSLVVNGFDPIQLAEAEGRRVFNAALPRLTPEELSLWLDTVIRLAHPDLVIYGTESRDVRMLGTDPGSCGGDVEDWVLSQELRNGAFSTVDAYEGLSWEHLMFGMPVHFAASDNYRAKVNEYGGKEDWAEVPDDELAASLARSDWEGPFPLCASRLEAQAANVAKLRSMGIQVVVVFMPVAELRVGQFDGGHQELEGVVAQMEAAVRAAGATAVLDFTDLLEASQFSDHIHANEEGRRIITAELIARLDALGL